MAWGHSQPSRVDGRSKREGSWAPSADIDESVRNGIKLINRNRSEELSASVRVQEGGARWRAVELGGALELVIPWPMRANVNCDSHIRR